MKTATIARFVLGAVAISAAAGLVGCGAETGQGSAEGVGQTSEALSSASLSALPTTPIDMRARGSVSCAFVDGTDRYHVKIGGFDASGATKKIDMAKNAAAWVQQTAQLTNARGQSEVYQIDATHCAVIGGNTALDGAAANALVDVDIVSLNTGVTPRIIAVSAATHGLAVARSQFKLSTCTDTTGDTHLLALGGKDLRSVESSPTIANLSTGTWTSTANILSANRWDFGADTDGSNDYVVAGGQVAGVAPNPSNTIELFTATKAAHACTPTTAVSPTTILNLSVATKGNHVFYDTSSSKFVVTSGIKRAGGVDSLWTDGDILTPSFAGTPDITAIAALGTIVGGYRPSFVRLSGNTVMLLGGASANLGASVATIQKYASGTVTSTTTGGAGIYLGSASYFSAANLVDFISGDSTPSTFGTLAVEVTP
jgi:hypothetical protein